MNNGNTRTTYKIVFEDGTEKEGEAIEFVPGFGIGLFSGDALSIYPEHGVKEVVRITSNVIEIAPAFSPFKEGA